MSSIFERATSRARWSGCPMCGKKAVVTVQVEIRQLGPKSSHEGESRRSISRMTSFCQEHGEEAFMIGTNAIGKEVT